MIRRARSVRHVSDFHYYKLVLATTNPSSLLFLKWHLLHKLSISFSHSSPPSSCGINGSDDFRTDLFGDRGVQITKDVLCSVILTGGFNHIGSSFWCGTRRRGFNLPKGLVTWRFEIPFSRGKSMTWESELILKKR